MNILPGTIVTVQPDRIVQIWTVSEWERDAVASLSPMEDDSLMIVIKSDLNVQYVNQRSCLLLCKHGLAVMRWVDTELLHCLC